MSQGRKRDTVTRTDSNSTSATMRDMLYVLFKHQGTIVVFTLACLFVAVFYSYLYPPGYKACAKILIKIEREGASPGTGVLKPSSLITTIRPEEIINSEIELLKGRYLAEQILEDLGDAIVESITVEPVTRWQRIKYFVKKQVAELGDWLDTMLSKMGLKKKLTPREKLIGLIAGGLQAESIKNSNVVTVSFIFPEPEMAALIVNRAVDIYIKQRVQVHRASTALGFFSSQAEKLKADLAQAELRLKGFKDQWDVSLLAEQRSHLLGLDAEMQGDVNRVDGELARLRGRVDATGDIMTEGKLAVDQGEVINSSAVTDSLKLKLIDLKLRRVDLSLKYADGNPFISSVDEEIEEVASELHREELKSAVSIDIESLQAKRDKLQSLLAESKAKVKRINRLEYELVDLEREVRQAEKLYETYFEKAEESRIVQAMDTANITNVRIIEPAYPPIVSVRSIGFIPQRIFSILMALVVGVFVSLSFVALREGFDRSIKSAEEVQEYLNLKVLGVVSDHAWLRRRAWGSGQDIGAEEIAPEQVAVEYHKLKNNLSLMNNGESLGTILIGGSRRGEGASTLASNLARVMAEDGGAGVVLLDLDFRSVSQQPRKEQVEGLCDCVLTDVPLEGVVRKVGGAGLSLVGLGKAECEPMRIIESDKFASILDTLKKEFRCVIIDSAALGAYPESTTLASKADGVILLVQAERTRREIVADTSRKLAGSGAKVLGVVLNRVEHYIPRFIYRRL